MKFHASLPALTLLLILLVSATPPSVLAVWLDLPQSGIKCVSEEIQPNVVVVADYTVFHEDHSHGEPTISAKVTSPHGNTLHYQENVKAGQFAFTTSEAGEYVACFWLGSADIRVGTTINLEWRIGIAAKDWDAVAKKHKIEGVELELSKLEEAVEEIHENLMYLKSREAEMREVSEDTNTRVVVFSMMALGTCILASGLQTWYLQTFFQRKKLI